MLCKQKILSLTKCVTLLQRSESVFLSTVFLCFTSSPNTFFGQKKHCTVCKNSLHCCKGKRQPYYLTVLLAFTSSKICFGNKKLLSLTKYVPLLQRSESVFLSTVFLCFTSSPNTFFGQKKHCTVCKNSLHCCKGKRQPYYLTVLLAFTSSKICFGNKKLLSLTKYVPLLQRSEPAFLSTVFCVLLVPQTRFLDKKHCTVCKNSLHFCVCQCTTKDEVWKKTFPSCNF